MTLRECLQLAKDAGFDGIELNYDLDNDLSPKAGTKEFHAIRKMAEEIGIAISGLCSFLYWPYSLTDNDSARRDRGLELATLMIQAAHDLGTENLLTIAGSTYIPWIPDREPVPDRRLRPPRPRGDRQAAPPGREARRLPEHREHLLQRLPDDARRDERLRRQLPQRARPRPLRHRQHHALPVPRALDPDPRAGGSRTSTSRSSPRRGPTTRSNRSARCSTARPTGRP